MRQAPSASRTGTERVIIQVSLPTSKQGPIRTPALVANGALTQSVWVSG